MFTGSEESSVRLQKKSDPVLSFLDFALESRKGWYRADEFGEISDRTAKDVTRGAVKEYIEDPILQRIDDGRPGAESEFALVSARQRGLDRSIPDAYPVVAKVSSQRCPPDGSITDLDRSRVLTNEAT